MLERFPSLVRALATEKGSRAEPIRLSDKLWQVQMSGGVSLATLRTGGGVKPHYFLALANSARPPRLYPPHPSVLSPIRAAAPGRTASTCTLPPT